MWSLSRQLDTLPPPSSSTSNGAYGGWFAKQSFPQNMMNKYQSVNTRHLSPVMTHKKYHTPTDGDMSAVSSQKTLGKVIRSLFIR